MLIFQNKMIAVPLDQILARVRFETNNKYFKTIRNKGNELQVTCPVHKDGQESKPACMIHLVDNDDTPYGTVHCFACGYTATFPEMIGYCFDEDEQFGIDWLIERFGNIFIEDDDYLPEIKLENDKDTSKYLDFNDLKPYNYYNEYMWKRGLTKEIVDKFCVGYDKLRDAITFPMWDENNNLVGVTARSTKSKIFWIPEDLEKPVYLLNVCLYEKKPCIYICESQLNALRLWTWGYPGVALFGTGSPHQYDVLNKCGIRNFITCFDGDSAGAKGRYRFHKNIKDAFITDCILPKGKDICDLTKEEFENLKQV
jgi:DNA primase